MSFVFGANSASTGYNLTRSLRFRASATGYLSKTFGSAGSQQKWTFSAWVKRGLLGSAEGVFIGTSAAATDATTFEFRFGGDALIVNNYFNVIIQTSAVYRDPSAWYHVVLALDTTQATASDRLKLYVNGSQVTAFATDARSTYITQNSNLAWNGTQVQGIGATNYTHLSTIGRQLDGYLAEVNFINNQQLTPSSFGSTNALTGVWQPARYTGTYGTNGFYLPFTDNSGATSTTIGKDFSGNSNNWTPNNISVTAGVTYDSMTDVPTLTSATAANFAVLNPLDVSATQLTLSNGNLTATQPSTGTSRAASSTFRVSTGKWYFEGTTTVTSGNSGSIGIADNANAVATYGGYRRSGGTFGLTGNPTFATYTNGDVIGVAFDADAKTVSFYKNGTLQGTGGYTYTGSDPVGSRATVDSGDSTGAWQLNFGQRPFTYTAPTGFVALNTYNLPTSTIVKGNTVMDATLWAGNSSTQSIVNAAAFKTDFVWIKNRTGANNHALFDSVRGATLRLYSDSTIAEQTEATTLTAFNSNGFSLSTSGAVNASANNYVGWQWQAGQGSTSSNTNGTITSTVSVNASAGFSVVTYTGTGANATVGHGLGVAPSLIICKSRGSATNWGVWHTSLTAYSYFLLLNTTAAQATAANSLQALPTSTLVSLGASSIFNDASTMVMYAWTPIAGYSAFGSYTGNGSTDGPMIYTGFKPRWIMFKRSDSGAYDWVVLDTSRDTYNAAYLRLLPNTSGAEDTGVNPVLDFLSNGFKVRSANNVVNASGGTYIYAAFASNPFRNSLAQ